MSELDEPILRDDYPVNFEYFYLVDGVVTRSPIQGEVQDLKRFMGAQEIRRCDMFGRKMFGEA